MQGKRWVAVLVLGAIVAVVPPVNAQEWLDDPVQILAVSNRADLVSGGDVLLEVVLPARAAAGDFAVTVGGRDVTAAFAARDGGRVLGMVDGLDAGTNTVTVTLPDGSGATLEVTNHPSGGPIFAGPQVQPWVCRTEEQGLGAPLDEKCTAPPVVTYSYMPEGGTALQPYEPENPPSDVATTTTDSGQTVPFIVRVEKGSMDRGIYGFAALFDPAAANEPWAQDNWDGKITTSFGGSCAAAHQQPGAGVTLNAANTALLGRGFGVIGQGLFALGMNCNEVVAAEALMMLRERMTEVLGEIRYAITSGCSGGSMMQLTISNAYPGLLDGINPSCTYPDQWTTWIEATDCSLLHRYFNETSPHLWAVEEQRARVSGHMAASTCALWDATFAAVALDPTGARCAPANQEWAYDPETNPEGERCSLADYQVAIWGRRPESVWGDIERQIGRGFARRPLDSVGVRYGLRALQSGFITAEQFVDLNEKIGGWDIDGNWKPERTVADPGAVEIAYRAGRVTQGHNLDQVAIIDVPAGIVPSPVGDNLEFHTAFRSRMLRDRLIASTGSAGNHVLARGGRPDALNVLDEWIGAVVADDSDDPREEKIRRHRPTSANNDCIIAGERVSDEQACAAAYPYWGDPRIAAGGPTTDDILKCQLAPLDREDPLFTDYGITFSDAQWERLTAAYPEGVCDYTRRSVGDAPVVGWLTYLAADGSAIPGGEPLGEPPVSVPFGPERSAPAPAPAPAPVTVTRHRGVDRVETAIEVSGLNVGAAETVVVARADEYADALAGAPLAVHLGAPLLLSSRDALSSVTADEVRRLGASEAVLLGGDAALSSQVATDLENLGLGVRRVRGVNRFATAVAIKGEMPSGTDVLVARGDGFADALAASALGAATTTPVLLAQEDALPAATAAALDDGDSVTIVGGEAAIGPEVAAALDSAAGTVTRLAGPTRYGTSAAVAEAALARGVGASTVWVATGRNFPDALVAGAAAGRDGGVLLLVDGSDLAGSPETRDWLVAHAADIREVRIAGGTDAVSAQVEHALAEVFSSQQASRR